MMCTLQRSYSLPQLQNGQYYSMRRVCLGFLPPLNSWTPEILPHLSINIDRLGNSAISGETPCLPTITFVKLISSLAARNARVGTIDLGYVGLPLAIAVALASFAVTGLDVDPARIVSLDAGVAQRNLLSQEDPMNQISADLGIPFVNALDQGAGEERRQFAHSGCHIFGNPIGLYMCRTVDLEQFLVCRTDSLGESIIGHVQAVGFAAGDHQ